MKRFYKAVTVQPNEGGYAVALDGRLVKTQTGRPQVVPSAATAELLAAEWERQGETIEPKSFRHRDMADYAIDMIAQDRRRSIDKLLSYGETDTLCYRADPDEALYARQQEEWEPILSALEDRLGITMTRVSGVMHKAQGESALARLREEVEGLDDFTLAALETMASLAASLTAALGAMQDDADAGAIWDAAQLEERWQIEQWGEDAEAARRMAERREAFMAAHAFAASLRSE
ncbi:ATP12 family protein [Qipengyuania atrilutea]|uniref:Molecular chaperone n=1 Tax=Qipengyuania atrilutea TaxID=2744473 RepID=A0A850H0L3_9SPHN|nr:ATP12 family protein [Actirhodobacter atriluteus]NVD45431.1 molecular chaperone [Actirhodobacter atriluteus]